jgi:hypothetical protein
MRRWPVAIVIALLPFAAQAQTEPDPVKVQEVPPRPPMKERLFWGGAVGLGFGDVDYVEISPLIGLRVNPKVDVGLAVTYRWRNDDFYDISTTDYGSSLFGRFRVWQNLFLEADWEYLNWEYVRADLSESRETTSSFLAGAGYYLPLGGRTSMAVSALYNFSYDENDPMQPYGDPWVIRAGFAVGF